MVCLGFKPRAAEMKAQMNPLSYGGTPPISQFLAEVAGTVFLTESLRSLWLEMMIDVSSVTDRPPFWKSNMEILLKDGKNKDDEIRRNRFLTRMLNCDERRNACFPEWRTSVWNYSLAKYELWLSITLMDKILMNSVTRLGFFIFGDIPQRTLAHYKKKCQSRRVKKSANY